MKINDTPLNVQRSGSFQESTFKLKASAKAFDILSSKIYEDKVRAIIRELSTNAADAHVDAGNPDTPFEIHLPNTWEPYFYIRDFGTGLSPEQVVEVYTVFFESTRTTSNDFTGCLGIGSKAPFSYTDNFLVTSWYNGTEYTYSAFRNEHGMPSIALMAESPTEEPNGLKIHIAVPSQDHDEFRQKAISVYVHFRVKPKCVGQSPALVFPNPTPVAQGKGWKLYGDSWSYPTLVMGNVGYRVNDDSNRFSSSKLTLEAPLGAVDIAASREGLHYSERTNKFLKEQFDRIHKELIDSFADQLCELPSRWDAYKWANKLTGTVAHFLKRNQQALLYRDGTRLVPGMRYVKTDSYYTSYLALSNQKVVVSRKGTLNGLDLEQPYIFVIDDLNEKGTETRCRAMVKREYANNHKVVAVVVKPGMKESLFKRLGIDESLHSDMITYASKVVKPSQPRRSRKPRLKTNAKCWQQTSVLKRDVEYANVKLYVHTHRGNPVYQEEALLRESFALAVRRYGQYSGNTVEVYGLNKTNTKQLLKENPNAREFVDFLIEEVTEKLKDKTFCEKLGLVQALEKEGITHNYKRTRALVSLHEKYTGCSPEVLGLLKFFAHNKEHESLLSFLSLLSFVEARTQTKLQDSVPKYSVSKALNTLCDKYRMFKYIWFDDSHVNDYLDYINLVDNS
jgi:hypothetical protein